MVGGGEQVAAGLAGGERLEVAARGGQPYRGGDVTAEEVFAYAVGQGGRQDCADVADGGRADVLAAAVADRAAAGPAGLDRAGSGSVWRPSPRCSTGRCVGSRSRKVRTSLTVSAPSAPVAEAGDEEPADQRSRT